MEGRKGLMKESGKENVRSGVQGVNKGCVYGQSKERTGRSRVHSESKMIKPVVPHTSYHMICDHGKCIAGTE